MTVNIIPGLLLEGWLFLLAVSNSYHFTFGIEEGRGLVGRFVLAADICYWLGRQGVYALSAVQRVWKGLFQIFSNWEFGNFLNHCSAIDLRKTKQWLNSNVKQTKTQSFFVGEVYQSAFLLLQANRQIRPVTQVMDLFLSLCSSLIETHLFPMILSINDSARNCLKCFRLCVSECSLGLRPITLHVWCRMMMIKSKCGLSTFIWCFQPLEACVCIRLQVSSNEV